MRGESRPHLERALARQLEHLVVEEEEPRQAEPPDELQLVVESGRAPLLVTTATCPAYRSPNAWSQISASWRIAGSERSEKSG